MQLAIITIYVLLLTFLFILSIPNFSLLLYNKFFNRKIITGKNELKNNEHVTIQLPIYNEFYVVERLINSVCEIEYPQNLLEIQILDDSTDETIEKIDEIVRQKKENGFNIKILRRKERTGFKAGALREGIDYASGEFIAVFDADFVPKKDFLKHTLPYFDDPKTGVVQTRWEHLNEGFSILTKIQASVLDNHFVFEQKEKYKAGLYINFNGTGGVWRKKTILDAGNWQDDTLTEDLDLSYRAQLKGWKFIYLNEVGTPAELPVEINAIKTQQFRWTKGSIETAKKILPKIWKANISFPKKIFASFHLTNNFVFPIILTLSFLNIPLLIIKSEGAFSGLFNFMSIFLTVLFTTFLIYLSVQKTTYPDWKSRISMFPVYLAGTMGLSVNNSKAVLEAVYNRKSDFIRTPKFKIVNSSSNYFTNKYLNVVKLDITLLLEIILAFYCSAGVLLAVYFSDYISIPVQLLFAVSFAGVSFYSIKSRVLLNRKEDKYEKSE